MSVRQMLIDTCLDLDLNRKAPEPRCLTMSFGISCKDSLHHCLSVPDATGYLVCKSATEQWHWHWTLPTMRCSIKERFKGKGGPFGGAKHHFADLRRRPPRLHPHQASDFRVVGTRRGSRKTKDRRPLPPQRSQVRLLGIARDALSEGMVKLEDMHHKCEDREVPHDGNTM